MHFKARGWLIGLAAVVATLLFNSWLYLRNLERVQQNAGWVSHTREVMATTEAILSAMTDGETGERGFVITGDARFLEPYQASRPRLDGLVARLQELSADNPRQQARINNLTELIKTRIDELERVIVVRRNDGFEAARQIILVGKGKQQMEAIRALVAQMLDEEQGLLKGRNAEAERSYKTAVFTGGYAALLGLGLVAAVFYLIQRQQTQKQRSSQIIHDERERFRTTLTSIGDAVIVTDVQGRITLLNAVAQTLTGWKDEAVGRGLTEVFHIVNEQSRQPVESPVGRVLRTGAIAGLANHTVLIAKDGTALPIDDSGAPIRNDRGEIIGVVLVFRDVSERRRTEEELRETNRRKDEFLAMLAHELRNPLAPIRNTLHILRHHAPADEKLSQAFAMMERQVQHMVRMVDDLMDVSRLTRGRITLKKEPVDLAAVVDRAIETSRPLIEARGHRLEVTLPSEPIRVEADPTRLAQVIANLLNNSAKYTKEHGTIWAQVEVERGQAVIRVRDTGVGILPEMQGKIFELFTQVDRTLDRAEGGLGIGLTLVRRLVEKHGGTVEVFSEGKPGKGSEFVVRLPLLATPERPASSAEPSAAAPEKEQKPRARILVVDDNKDAAESLAMLLRLHGHDVALAFDGPGAIQAVATFRPQLVFLDIGLPGMNGYEVGRQIRTMSDLWDVRIVAMTGYGNEEDRRRSEESGFDQHLVKPLDPVVLEGLVNSFSGPRDHRRSR